MTENVYVRAHLSLGIAAQETCDLARGVVGDLSTPMTGVERIKKARRVRLLGLSVVDRAVLAVLSEGGTWAEVAEGLGVDEATAVLRYSDTWADWLNPDPTDPDFGDYTLGLTGDQDAAGTAAMLDQWYNRHRDPWDDPNVAQPATQVLVHGKGLSDGQATASDG